MPAKKRISGKRPFLKTEKILKTENPKNFDRSPLGERNEYDLFAISRDGTVVSLRGIAVWSEGTALDFARNRVKNMTRLEREWLNLAKNCRVIAVLRT